METIDEELPENGSPRGRIIPVNIEEQMKSAYIDYSMSVIVGRALPDARDGLNQFTAVFYTVCMKWEILTTNLIKNQPVSSVM